MHASYLARAGSKPVKSGENSYESAIWTFNPQTKQFTGVYARFPAPLYANLFDQPTS